MRDLGRLRRLACAFLVALCAACAQVHAETVLLPAEVPLLADLVGLGRAGEGEGLDLDHQLVLFQQVGGLGQRRGWRSPTARWSAERRNHRG